MGQLSLFDYAALDSEDRVVVQHRTSEIKTLMRKSAQDIIEIGVKLAEVKERLKHGEFLRWVEVEFGWSERSAYNFMAVAEQFKVATVATLAIGQKALYTLAAPSTPEPARAEAVARAEKGETITHTKAKAIVAAHKVPPGRPAAPPSAPAKEASPKPARVIIDKDGYVERLRSHLAGLHGCCSEIVSVGGMRFLAKAWDREDRIGLANFMEELGRLVGRLETELRNS